MNGGTWLNAYDGALPAIHRDHGFTEQARLRWDETQAPEGWDSKHDDSPDVVFMAHGIPAQPGRYFDSWDEAEAAAKAHA